MHEDTAMIGSPITLAELSSLGEFVRWQDVGSRVANLVEAHCLPNGYPIVPTRLPASSLIDLFVNKRWQQVRYVRMEGSLASGDRQIVYNDENTERTTPYNWYGVAPAGYYTEWQSPRPNSLDGAKLLEMLVQLAPNAACC